MFKHNNDNNKNILAIFGATGHQGSSIIHYVQNDATLSQKYPIIRAITRDVNSDQAKQLTLSNNNSHVKIEVVRGDAQDSISLAAALAGAHTVFAMTTPDFGPDAVGAEYARAQAIADAAVSQGVEYLVFSTLPAVGEISGGKYARVTPFDAKAKAERYIRGLPIRSAFYAGGWFMENFEAQTFLAPKLDADGTTWVMSRNSSPQTKMPLVDAIGDTGKFVGAILAEPDKYEGKTFTGAVALYTLEEVAAILSKATGKNVVYRQISTEDFKKTLPPGLLGDIFVDAYSFQDEYGYFGPGTEESVAWAVENARGRLTTLEEYFEAHPLRLE